MRSARPPGICPPGTLVVPVPLRRYPASAGDDLALRAMVAAAYGATHLLADTLASPGAVAGSTLLTEATGRPAPVIPVISPGDWAYDPVAEVWRPLALIEAGTERADLSPGELEDLLDRGAEVPAVHPARGRRRAAPGPAAAQRAGAGHLPHRAVRLGQVHAGPVAA